jgi:hypothetical protein
MLGHKDIRQKISTIVDNQYNREDVRIVENHIATCRSCRAFKKQVEQLSATMKKWIDDTIPKDLERAINSLPKDQKEAITLLEYHKLSYEKISRIIHCPVEKVPHVLYKARLKLLNKNPVLNFLRVHLHKILTAIVILLFLHVGYQIMRNERTVKYIMNINQERADINTMMNYALNVATNKTIQLSFDKGHSEGTASSAETTETKAPAQPVIKRNDPKKFPAGDVKVRSIQYRKPHKNRMVKTEKAPVSRFPLNVKTFSYTMVKQFVETKRMPPRSLVRVEELINSFVYAKAAKQNNLVNLDTEIGICPWNPDHFLLFVKLYTQTMPATKVLLNQSRISVKFNQDAVQGYNLIGYKNYKMPRDCLVAKDDEGEDILSNYMITAFYEFEARHLKNLSKTKQIKYSDPLVTVRFRYKTSNSDTAQDLIHELYSNDIVTECSEDFLFAAAVAEYGLLLNESPLKGKASFDHILRQARDAQGEDPFGYRKHFIRLVEKTRALQ